MKSPISMREALALCDINRARRTEPSQPLVRLSREEQRAFWRRVPVLTSWRESRR